jgi:hypothetical protein
MNLVRSILKMPSAWLDLGAEVSQISGRIHMLGLALVKVRA